MSARVRRVLCPPILVLLGLVLLPSHARSESPVPQSLDQDLNAKPCWPGGTPRRASRVRRLEGCPKTPKDFDDWLKAYEKLANFIELMTATVTQDENERDERWLQTFWRNMLKAGRRAPLSSQSDYLVRISSVRIGTVVSTTPTDLKDSLCSDARSAYDYVAKAVLCAELASVDEDGRVPAQTIATEIKRKCGIDVPEIPLHGSVACVDAFSPSVARQQDRRMARDTTVSQSRQIPTGTRGLR